jgi:hypothetical protein
MARRNRGEHGGSTLVEFTLVGIPMIFVLISTFEMARGMWTWQTLNFAVKEGTRYAGVHGQACATAPNTCTVTVAQIAQTVASAGVGLIPSQLSLTFISPSSSRTCRVTPSNVAGSCLADNTVWPEAPTNGPGNDIEIDAVFPFQSAISMFWPGAGPGMNVGLVNFGASSKETMHN